MKSIQDVVGNVPNALRLMVAGIRRQHERESFRIDMDNFGRYDGGENICVGCAATCALQEAAKVNFLGEEINWSQGRANYLDFSHNESKQFEVAIDHARTGSLERLFLFFNDFGWDSAFDDNWYIETGNYMTEIEKVEDFLVAYEQVEEWQGV